MDEHVAGYVVLTYILRLLMYDKSVHRVPFVKTRLRGLIRDHAGTESGNRRTSGDDADKGGAVDSAMIPADEGGWRCWACP